MNDVLPWQDKDRLVSKKEKRKTAPFLCTELSVLSVDDAPLFSSYILCFEFDAVTSVLCGGGNS
jgi:hypothetical protein